MASVDTSLVDALTQAGVPDQLVDELGQTADATGYGLGPGNPLNLEQRQSFAVVQITTCREVAAGNQSWAEVRAADTAGGAPQGSAKVMASFLRRRFCPAVGPAKNQPRPASAKKSKPVDGSGARGVMSSVSWWDGRFKSLPASRCVKYVGEPFGEGRAFQLDAHTILCTSVPPVDDWQDHLIDVDIVFTSPVTEARAVKVARSLLPSDTRAAGRKRGANPDYAANRGSCMSVLFQSPTLKSIVADVNPGWGATKEAAAVLYSTKQTDQGSAGQYNGKVRQVALGTGGHNDVSGPVIC